LRFLIYRSIYILITTINHNNNINSNSNSFNYNENFCAYSSNYSYVYSENNTYIDLNVYTISDSESESENNEYKDIDGPTAEDIKDMEKRLGEVKRLENSDILPKLERGENLNRDEQDLVEKVINEHSGFFKGKSVNETREGIKEVRDYIEDELNK
jgi:hypothetical protein